MSDEGMYEVPGPRLRELADAARRSRLEEFRQLAPVAACEFTQLVVDNPGQFALVIAGSVVATRAAVNIVRPRTGLQAVALMIVLQAGVPKLAKLAMDRGWLTFRVRDADGNLVPLVQGKVTGDAPAPAA